MQRVTAGGVAALLVDPGGDAWTRLLGQIVPHVGADVAFVLTFGPPTLPLGIHGVIPAEILDDPGAQPDAIGARLARAGFDGAWIRRTDRDGTIAFARRGGFTDDAIETLDALSPILLLGLFASAERTRAAQERATRDRLEERLERLERQSTLGMVAAAVAHDLAAPVSALLMEGSEIRKRVLELSTILPDAGPALRNVIEDLRGLADHCMEATERARYLLTDFRLAARSGGDRVIATQSVQIGDALRACIRLVRPLARDRVKVDLVVDGGLPSIPGARPRLEQAFTNLLVNAIHAASVREGRAGLVKVTAAQRGDEVVVEFTDNGAGIPPELRERVFEPFFSTKPAEVGTGLGLPITREIVEAHGGRIEMESERGRGACFRIRLPIQAPTPAAGRNRPVVLVVDGDPALGAMLRRALAGDFEVRTAENADHALELIGEGNGFDAMIVDISGPDTEGPLLFAKVRRRWPGLERKIIFAGTGSYTAASSAFLSSVSNRRFQTPITSEELRPIVESVIHAA